MLSVWAQLLPPPPSSLFSLLLSLTSLPQQPSSPTPHQTQTTCSPWKSVSSPGIHTWTLWISFSLESKRTCCFPTLWPWCYNVSSATSIPFSLLDSSWVEFSATPLTLLPSLSPLPPWPVHFIYSLQALCTGPQLLGTCYPHLSGNIVEKICERMGTDWIKVQNFYTTILTPIGITYRTQPWK